MYDDWSEKLELPDDVLDYIHSIRLLSSAIQCRESLLRCATLHHAWAPGLKKRGGLCDLVMRVPTSNAWPFHNHYPFEVYNIDGVDVHVGMWEDRCALIYIKAEDIQSWNHMKRVSIGATLFANSQIVCKRFCYKNAWYSSNFQRHQPIEL